MINLPSSSCADILGSHTKEPEGRNHSEMYSFKCRFHASLVDVPRRSRRCWHWEPHERRSDNDLCALNMIDREEATGMGFSIPAWP